MAIDTRIQFPTFLQQIGQAAASSSQLGSNVIGGMQVGERRREFDLQRADQQQAQQAAMQRFAQSAQAIGSIATQVRDTQDWGEKFRLLGSNPGLWTNDETRPAMQAMTNLTMQQYDVASKTGKMAEMAQLNELEKLTQKEVFETISGFQPNDRLRALALFKADNGQMSQDLYDFISEAQGRAPQKADASTADIRNFEQEQSLQAELEQARTTGDAMAIESAQQRLARFREMTAPSGMVIETTPEGGTRIVQGRGAGGTTVGTQSQLQQRVSNTRHAMDVLTGLSGMIRPEDVGFQGVIGEFLDRAAPQLGIDALDFQRQDTRTKLRTSIQSMLRILSPDTRFTEEDRRRVESITPSLGVMENAPRANKIIDTLTELMSKRVIYDLRDSGMPLDYSSLRGIHEIRAAVLLGFGPDGQKHDISSQESLNKLKEEAAAWMAENLPYAR